MKKMIITFAVLGAFVLGGCAKQNPPPQQSQPAPHHMSSGKLGKLGQG